MLKIETIYSEGSRSEDTYVQKTTESSEFTVTEEAVRPNGENDKCYFCGRAIGEKHTNNCKTIHDVLRVHLTGSMIVPVQIALTEEGINRYADRIHNKACELLLDEFYDYEGVGDFKYYIEDPMWDLHDIPYLDESVEIEKADK